MTSPASSDDPAASRAGERTAGWLEDVPIFPLGTVLFPGGVLPLRVFEARYMDMVRACMQSGSPFGVCMITRGTEVGEAAEHEALGCLASIIDWDMEQLGLLQIRARGGQRFEARERRVQRDGLVRARIRLIGPDADTEVRHREPGDARTSRRMTQEVLQPPFPRQGFLPRQSFWPGTPQPPWPEHSFWPRQAWAGIAAPWAPISVAAAGVAAAAGSAAAGGGRAAGAEEMSIGAPASCRGDLGATAVKKS